MIILAPGVIFNKEEHKYWYKGKHLSGVTGKVSQSLGYKPITRTMQAVLEEAKEEGLYVHKVIEDYVDSNFTVFNAIHPGACFVKKEIDNSGHRIWQAETLVSDFNQYASAVDLISINEKGELQLWDIKRKFSRDYVTRQLSIYKFFIERTKTAKYKVSQLNCFATKDLRVYELDYIGDKMVEEILYG